MTKQWPEPNLLAPPALTHLGENYDNQLDLCRNVEPSFPPSGVARSAPSRNAGDCGPAPMSPQQLLMRPEKCSSTTIIMDKPATTTSMAHNAHAQNNLTAESLSRNTWTNSDKEEKRTGGGKKKNYQRYPKPPYSYLAMIAMVIQRSPEKKLTLSEILKEISSLFPFFKGNYKGWRDSVRHNLSSYDCFVKVLKDPGKPQGKGNFWAVELSRVPLELLKRQNTAVSRQDETIFAQDLAPYILQGNQQESEPPPPPMTSLPPMPTENPSHGQDDFFRPKLDSSFAIDSLLHSLQPALGPGDADSVSTDCWGEVDRVRPLPAPRPPHASSARSASASSASPASTSSSSSDEEWKDFPHLGKRLPPEGETGSGGYEDCRPPSNKSARRDTVAPPWELPTSYAKYAPPNAVAPPSMRFNGGPLMPLHGGLPLYGYSSSPVTHSHFLSHTYWPIIPSSRVAVQAPQLIMDLDNLLQTVPPNKSVFDVLVHTSQNSNHQPQSQFSLQSRAPLNRFHPF